MAIFVNGKPIDEAEFEYADRNRAEEMRNYRRDRGWGREPDTMQSGSHRACDTPRRLKHGKNIRTT